MIKFDVFFLPHAKRQLLERGIAVEDVEKVLLEPGQLLNTEIKGRKIAQKVFKRNGRRFLYRVIFAEENGLKTIITAYRTTKISKYWEEK